MKLTTDNIRMKIKMRSAFTVSSETERKAVLMIAKANGVKYSTRADGTNFLVFPILNPKSYGI